MRFGITHMIPLILFCLNFQLSYSQDTLVTTQWPHIVRVSDFQTSTFRGRDCDDTEYRNDSGSPAWKNYGGWLSECDSLADAWEDSTMAIIFAKRKREKAIQDSIDMASVEDIDFDLDAMWDNTVWKEIESVADAEVF